MTEPVVLRVKDFCLAYGVKSRTTVYELARRGEIEMVRDKGLRRTVITRKSADEWVARHQRTT